MLPAQLSSRDTENIVLSQLFTRQNNSASRKRKRDLKQNIGVRRKILKTVISDAKMKNASFSLIQILNMTDIFYPTKDQINKREDKKIQWERFTLLCMSDECT